MVSIARVPEVQFEPLGHVWVAFSPASGETALLNDESAAILEVLEAGPATSEVIAATLALDSGIPAADLAATLETAWPRLVNAGLVRAETDSGLAPQ